MLHHSHERAIRSLVKMSISGRNDKIPSCIDTTPPWVKTTIKKVEGSLADNIAKCKKKEKKYKKYLLRNRDDKTWEVWQKGAFGRDKMLVAAEYRNEIEHYLYNEEEK